MENPKGKEIEAYEHRGKKILEVQTQGENCTCDDCPVLYGEECLTGIGR